MSYHDQIMNIPAEIGGAMFVWPLREVLAFKTGHCDARHAAAEIALQADAKIEFMREALQNARSLLRSYGGDGVTRGDEILKFLLEQIDSAIKD